MDNQPHGNFVAFMNRTKQPGDRKPAFDGRLGIPGAEAEHRFVLWAHEYTNPKTGELQIMFNGQVDAVKADDAPLDQIAALLNSEARSDVAAVGNLKLAPRQLVLFPNGFKDAAPDKKRPDYWGAFNPGQGNDIVRISVWARKDRNDHAMLAGATSYPIPGKNEAEMQDAAQELADLVEEGAVTKGMPARKRGTAKEGRA